MYESNCMRSEKTSMANENDEVFSVVLRILCNSPLSISRFYPALFSAVYATSLPQALSTSTRSAGKYPSPN